MSLGARPRSPYVEGMRSWSASCLAAAALACTLAVPDRAEAADPAPKSAETPTTTDVPRKRERVRALEVQAVGMTQVLPRPGFGGDLAFAFGLPNFQARVGALFVGVPAFQVGEGEIANALTAATLDLCAAKPVLRHQIRMCLGGQGGVMNHIWKGYEVPGRRSTPWAAGTLRGDYQLKITDHFGVMGGVGVVIPIVGPSFTGQDAFGSPTPMVFPGPMAGFLSLGTTFRW